MSEHPRQPRRRKPAPAAGQTAPPSPVERQDELDQLELVDRLKNEAGTGAYVRIYRRLSGETEYSRVGKMTLEDYSEDRVEELYGGGDYKVQASTSLHKFVKAWSFKIDSSIPPKHPKARPDAGGAAPDAGGGDSVALVKALLEDRGAGGGGESLGTKELFMLMIKQQESADRRFEAMLTKLGAAKSQDESPLMMLLMKSVLDQKHTPLKEVVETMSLFKKMQGGRGGTDDDDEDKKEDFLDKLGRILGPMAASVAEKLLNGEPVTAPGPKALRGPAATGTPEAMNHPAVETAATPAPGEATNLPPMNLLVKAAIRDIRAEALKTAAAGGDPLEFAAHVDSMIPDSFADQVEAAAKADNWFATFFGDTPQAEQHREWLTKVRDELLELLKPEEEPAE